MFACVQLIPAAAPRLLERRRQQPPTLVRIHAPRGAPFFRLEVPTRRGQQTELPWAAMEQAAGRLRTRLLFPEGVIPPPPPPARSAAQAQLEPGLRAFQPKRLPLLLCLRAAQQTLLAAQTPARELRVTVVDTKGVLSHAIDLLVPLAGSLRVYTPDFSIYRSAAARVLHRYGATLILSDSVGCFAQSHVIIADDLRLFTGREAGLIFTPDTSTNLAGCHVVRCHAPQIPQTHANLCPPGIDLLQFACALFELCGIKELERMPFDHYAFDGVSGQYSAEDLARQLEEIQSRSCLSINKS